MSLFTWISSCRLECFQSKSTLLNISPKPKMLCLQAKKRRNNIPEPDQSPQSSNKLCAVGEQRTGTADSTRSKDHVWGNTCVDGHDCLVQIGFMTCYTSALLWMGLSYYSWFCWSLTLETVLTEFFEGSSHDHKARQAALAQSWLTGSPPGGWRWPTSAVISSHPWLWYWFFPDFNTYQ